VFDVLTEAQYVRWLRAHGMAASTIRRRRNELEAWARWCGDPLDPAAATHDQVLDMLDARGLTAASRNQVLVNLRGFYRWARLELDHSHDPTLRVPMPRIPAYLPRPAVEADVAVALAAAEGRMHTMVALAALAGLRVSEIAALRWDDIDLTARTMRIVGKNRRVRVVPISHQLAAILDRVDRASATVVAHTQTGRPLSANFVSAAIADWLRSIGVDATAHQLRHRFGTILYRACRDVLLVARVMGHANVATTQGYADVAAVDALRAVDAMADPSVSDLLGPAVDEARGWRIRREDFDL
jgi:integrase/recombinase XerD